jgi:ketosteroid isomerase-like protein
MSETGTDAATTAKSFLAALQAADFDRMRELLSEDATWTFMSTSLGIAPLEGREAIVGFFSRPSRFEGGRGPSVTLTRVVAQDGAVAIEATGKATLTTGGEYDNHYHYAIDTEAGRVKAVRHYQDSLHIATLMRKPAAT